MVKSGNRPYCRRVHHFAVEVHGYLDEHGAIEQGQGGVRRHHGAQRDRHILCSGLDRLRRIADGRRVQRGCSKKARDDDFGLDRLYHHRAWISWGPRNRFFGRLKPPAAKHVEDGLRKRRRRAQRCQIADEAGIRHRDLDEDFAGTHGLDRSHRERRITEFWRLPRRLRDDSNREAGGDENRGETHHTDHVDDFL